MPYRPLSTTRVAQSRTDTPLLRIKTLGVIFVLLAIAVTTKLFYLQIVQGNSYRQAADDLQIKSLAIPADRGIIYVQDGDRQVPLVLNKRSWTLFADSEFIEDKAAIKSILADSGLEVSQEVNDKLELDSRYIVLYKEVSDELKEKIVSSKVKGLYFNEESRRSYPEGSLAAHVLGFVNNDQEGQYGIEQAFSEDLSGVDGQLKAVTDASGTPLAFEDTNIAVEPKNGQDIILTLDIVLQQLSEDTIEKHVAETSSKSGSVIILEAETGAIRAMSNFPTYDPNTYSVVEDIGVFTNSAITTSIEPGSVMKPIVMATAFDKNVVNPDDTFDDKNSVEVEGAVITNALDYGNATRPIKDILSLSLNTGSVYLLSLLGGGDLNLTGRQIMYDYLINFGLGSKTGVELPNEASGVVFGPTDGYGLNIRYANMTFGQGLTVTPIQLAAAYGALFNGGDLYKPYIVSSAGGKLRSPELVRQQVISAQTSEELRSVMRQMAIDRYGSAQVAGLEISGKTGTGQIPNSTGGYLEDAYTGTFAGYVKSNDKTLIIIIRLEEPQVRFAGSQAAAPAWEDIANGIVKTGKINE